MFDSARFRAAVATVAVLAGVRGAAALAPLGDEFLVNSYTTSDQRCPVVAAAPDGSFAIVWKDRLLGGPARGRVFDSGGMPQGSEFLIDDQVLACSQAIVAQPDGSFLVTWQAYSKINGVRYDANGVADEVPFFDVYSDGYDSFDNSTDITLGDQGEMVVVWNDEYYFWPCESSSTTTTTLLATHARYAEEALPEVRVEREGTRQGSPRCTGYTVSTLQGARREGLNTSGAKGFESDSASDLPPPSHSKVASAGHQGFHVVWHTTSGSSFFPRSAVKLDVRNSDTSRHRLVAVEGPVVADTITKDSLPSITMDRRGQSAVAWSSQTDCTRSEDPGCYSRYLGAQVRRFDRWGNQLATESPANRYDNGSQRETTVGGTQAGDVVAVWTSGDPAAGDPGQLPAQDGDGDGIFGRALDCAGVAATERAFTGGAGSARTDVGMEQQINQITAGDQDSAAVAVAANGNVIVTWASDDADGDGRGIKARRLALTSPCSACGDPNRDGSVTSNDALLVLRRSVDLVGDVDCPRTACDTDGSGDVLAIDALMVLFWAVDRPVDLACPRGPRT